MGVENGVVDTFQLFGGLGGVHDVVAEPVLQLVFVSSGGQCRLLVEHQLFLIVRIVLFAVHSRFFQVQGSFHQPEKVPVGDLELRHAVSLGEVRRHIPFVLGFRIGYPASGFE